MAKKSGTTTSAVPSTGKKGGGAAARVRLRRVVCDPSSWRVPRVDPALTAELLQLLAACLQQRPRHHGLVFGLNAVTRRLEHVDGSDGLRAVLLEPDTPGLDASAHVSVLSVVRRCPLLLLDGFRQLVRRWSGFATIALGIGPAGGDAVVQELLSFIDKHASVMQHGGLDESMAAAMSGQTRDTLLQSLLLFREPLTESVPIGSKTEKKQKRRAEKKQKTAEG